MSVGDLVELKYTHLNKGILTVKYKNSKDAQKALLSLQTTLIMGRKLDARLLIKSIRNPLPDIMEKDDSEEYNKNN